MKPALHFPRIGKPLLAAAFMAMAGAASAGKAIEGDIDAAKALTFLYGNVQTAKPGEKTISMSYRKEQDCTEWALHPLSAAYIDRFDYAIDAGDKGKKAEACKILAEKYTDGGVEKYMLVTVSKHFPQQDKEIPGIIVASTFVRKDGQWTLESHNDFTLEAHETGVVDFMATGRAGTEKPGVLFETISGNYCMEYFVYAILPYGGGTKLFRLFTPGSNNDYHTLDVCQNCYDTSISFDTATQGEYHDIIVAYNDDECGKSERGSQRWRFQNGKYVKVKDVQKAPKKGGKKGAKKRK